MKRKLIKQGKGGLTFYVPKKWADSKGLKPGDEIELTPADGELLLSAEAKLGKKEVKLNIASQNEKIIRIKLHLLYRKGFDRIVITYKTKKEKDVVLEEFERELLGFEITEQTKGKIVVENVTEPSEEKQEVLLRRMFLIIKNSFNIIGEDFEQSKFENLSLLQDAAKKINQYNSFCRRNISKKRFTNDTAYSYWNLYNSLLVLQRILLHFYMALSKTKKFKLPNKYLKFFDTIEVSMDEFYKGFFNKDIDLINHANDLSINLLYQKILPEIKKEKGEISLILYFFGELSRFVYLATIPALGILLE
jgi:phosphate uptake regulator